MRGDHVTSIFSTHARILKTAFAPHSSAHVPRRPLPASEQQCAHARCRDRHKLYSAYVGDHVTSFFSEHVRLLSTSFAPDSSAHVPLRPLPASEQQCAHARQVTPLQAAWIAARARVNNVGVTLRRKSGRGARDLRLQIRFNFKAMTMSWSYFLVIGHVTEGFRLHEFDTRRTLNVVFDLQLVAKHDLRLQPNVSCSSDGRMSPESPTVSS